MKKLLFLNSFEKSMLEQSSELFEDKLNEENNVAWFVDWIKFWSKKKEKRKKNLIYPKYCIVR
jgi:hypothetical protein